MVNPVSTLPAAGTGTQTSVASANTDTTILAANASRVRATIYNDSTAVLYLLFGAGTSSTTNYSVQVPPGGTWIEDNYTGIIKGIWASVNGNARVTENA